MRLIYDNDDLDATLQRLISKADSISIAVAWASSHTAAFKNLVKAKSKFKHIVVGTHFYQTDPAVLASFVNSETVRFVLQPAGVFHPKVYLFHKGKAWTLIVGSANFTQGALTKNSEVMVEICNADVADDVIKTDTAGLIQRYWKSAAMVIEADVERYRLLHSVQRQRLQKLSGTYGSTKTSKNPIQSDVMSMSWSQYMTRVRQDKAHGIDQRIGLMSELRNKLSQYPIFSGMPLELRKAIAGLPSKEVENSGWFGSMVGAGRFKNLIGTNSPEISLALGRLPADGLVDRGQYDAFIEDYVSAFPNGRHGIGTATRLLAMKRPDVFVCVDSKNRKNLCQELGIVQSGLDYERYWNEIVERVRDSPWWLALKPADPTEAEVWKSRAAFLDAIFYAP